MALILCKSHVRSMLEFNKVSWNLRYVREVNCVEKVQRWYTKRIWSGDSVSCSDRLQVCKLQTLGSRRRKIDLIYLYRTLQEDAALANIKIQLRPLSGVSNVARPKYHIVRTCNSFSSRCVSAWNNLPNVTACDSLKHFNSQYMQVNFCLIH